MSQPAPDTSPTDLARRLATWRVTRRPEILWPGVDEPSMRLAATRVVETTCAVIREASSPVSLPADGPAEEAAIRAMAFMTGMGPLLGYWTRSGLVRTSPALTHALQAGLEHAAARERLLLEELASLVGHLGKRGIPATVLKGAHTAIRYFPSPGTRPMADLDVLVGPEHFASAATALTELGFTERQRGGLPDRSEWARADVPMVHHSVELHHEMNPWMVDLHQSLNRRYVRGRRAGLGVPTAHDLSTHPTLPSAQVLRHPALAAFLAVHTSYGYPVVRLIHLVELIYVLRADCGESPSYWQELEDCLKSAGSLGLAWPAIALVDYLVPGLVPRDLLVRLGASATARARRFVGGERLADLQYPWAYSLEERLIWAVGWRDTVLALLDVVWPANASLADVGYLLRRRIWTVLSGEITASRRATPRI